MWGRLVFTDYATGCLRKIYLRSRGVRETIPTIHGTRGAIFEAKIGERLRAGGFDSVEAEAEIRYPVDGWPGTTFSGRMDYRVRGPDGDKIIELKSSESKTKLRQIKSGVFTTENLAQLVSYMIANGSSHGELRYGYLEPKDGVYDLKYERGFDVKVDDYGRLIIDGKPNRFTVYDQLAHTQAVAQVIETDTIYDRPVNHAAAFGSPCAYCKFAETCKKWDNGSVKLVDDFVNIARESLIKGESDE